MRPGQELPVFIRDTGFHNWNRFAGANDEFAIIHMDDDAGREAGYSAAFGMGNLQWAYLHNLLRGWLPPTGRIIRVACQFRGANEKGQTVTANGRIESLRPEGGEVVVELEVWTQAADGQRLAVGTATVAVPPDFAG
jgi:hypothetical protein